MVTIYNIPELIELIERRNLKSAQICKILEEGFKIFADETNTPKKLVKQLKEYWGKHQFSTDKPLFLDISIGDEEYLKSELISHKGSKMEYKDNRLAKAASIKYNTAWCGNRLYTMGKTVIVFTSIELNPKPQKASL